MTGRATIGLFNSYDRTRLAEAHRRALARAGTLAWAFEMNLGTFGFPFSRGAKADRAGPLQTPGDVAAWVADSTTIGDDGRSVRELADAGRIDTFDLPDPGFPPQLGSPVATTRGPDPGKARTVEAVARRLLQGESLLLVFGLGPSGLPDAVLEGVDDHLDVTGRGVSLETATAMGAVVGAIMTRVAAGQSTSR